MDKTVFGRIQKTKKFVAMHGRKNVRKKTVKSNCHVTITACVRGSDFPPPTLFIVPGKIINRDVMDAFDVAGSTANVSPKVLKNSSIFVQWSDNLENTVTGSVDRPLFLVYDGYGSHYNYSIIAKGIEQDILLILIPDNATHFI